MSPLRAHASYLLLALPAVLVSCTTVVYKETLPQNAGDKYDTAFPYRDCSAQLAEIGNSVKLLSCIAYYRNYSFALDERLRADAITPAFLSGMNRKPVYTTSTGSGTATIVLFDGVKMAAITCAHVVDFPDTVLQYFIDDQERPTPFVKALAIKDRQTNYLAMFPDGGDMEILAVDKTRDIAVMGHRFKNFRPPTIPVFRYPLGQAKDLTWGSFVYLFGYPSGYQIVTTGVVSSPNRDKNASFLVDAVVSRGFSGGIALAMRNGPPHFELVGMVKLVSGRSSYALIPPPTGNQQEYDFTVPYRGDIYVGKEIEIQYGVSQAVSVDAIRDFLEEHEAELSQEGYPLLHFWGKE